MNSTTKFPFTYVNESFDLDSSMIESVTYLNHSHSLLVFFKNGHVYKYEDVPHTIFEILVDADSAGKYFNKAIRGFYDFERVA